jgi:hypothetical protein
MIFAVVLNFDSLKNTSPLVDENNSLENQDKANLLRQKLAAFDARPIFLVSYDIY